MELCKLWIILYFRDLFLLRLNHLHLSNHQFILTILGCPKHLVKHYPHGITWIPAWISNDNVYPSPNVHGYTVSNFHPTLCNGCNYLSTLWLKLGARNRYDKTNFYRNQDTMGQVAHPKNPNLITNGWNSLKLIYNQMLVKFMICTCFLFKIHHIKEIKRLYYLYTKRVSCPNVGKTLKLWGQTHLSWIITNHDSNSSSNENFTYIR